MERQTRVIGAMLSSLLLMLFLVGCSSSTPTADSSSTSTPKQTLTNDQFSQLSGDPDNYKGYPVEITGQVFVAPETKDGVTTFQMWADPKNNDGNIEVYMTAGTAPKQDDFVKIKGAVKGKLEGENAMGATVTAVAINADSVEKVDAMNILAPAKQSVDVNKTVSQHGYNITLEKVEFADSETRAYVKVTNNANCTIHFWAYDAKAVQNSTQLDQQSNYDTDYPEVQSDILKGITSEGIVTFKPLDPSIKSARFIFDGSFDDYNIDFKPATFDITW